MPESVFVEIPVEVVEEAEELPSKTYRLDWDAGHIRGYTDGLDAVVQAVKKALITPRWKCLAYDNQYGCEIQEAVAQKGGSQEYLRAVIPGFIRDALRPDTRIVSVENINSEFVEDELHITFEVETIFGPVTIEEVL